MTPNQVTFATGKGRPPMVAILPSLEAIVSVRLGDDPEGLWAFWQCLTSTVLPKAPYVYNNRTEEGAFQSATDNHRNAIHQAITVACRGTIPGIVVDWATTTFLDVSDPDGLPGHSCTCSLGWVDTPSDPRGLSFRLTLPPGEPWLELLELGTELARGWPGLWRWISIGHRFVPVSWHSRFLGEAHRVIFGRSHRFLGVDVGDTLGIYTSFWQDCIRTVSWSLYLAPGLVGRLDPFPEIEKLRQAHIDVEPLGDAWRFCVGSTPVLGDLHRREDLSAYLTLDRALRSVRARGGINFLSPWDEETTTAWLDRFSIAEQNQPAKSRSLTEGDFNSVENSSLAGSFPTIIAEIVDQHAGEAAFLWILRDRAVVCPHYTLSQLADLDDRIESNVDGLRVAAEQGWEIAKGQLVELGGPGEVFAAGVLAFESGAPERIQQVIEVGTATPEASRGLISALGWLPYPQVSKTIKTLLAAESRAGLRAGLAAMSAHRKNPGPPALQRAFASDDPLLKARALRAVGEVGLINFQITALATTKAKDPACRFWAAWSRALLSVQRNTVISLQDIAEAGGTFAEQAAQMAMRRLAPKDAKMWLIRLVKELRQMRIAVVAAGAFADPEIIPFLIEQMKVPKLARVAGESLSLITGANIAYDKLEGAKPEGFEAGPTENPEDENVEMDPDENLPWPDPALIQKWWNARQGNFARGTRYLLGQPITPESLREALKTGFQRQRAAAALELAILKPGRPLFEVRAPAWRQQAML